MGAKPTRINITLDPEYAERLSRLAEQAYLQEGTLARSLLSRALDEADIDPRTMTQLLESIPGAVESIGIGMAQAEAGETIPLDEL